MKNIFIALAAALVLAGSTSRLYAQPAAGTKVAIVNVHYVFAKYSKAVFYTTELDNTLKPIKDKREAIAADMKKYGEAYKGKQVASDPALKDQYEKYLLKLRRDLEDVEGNARKLVGKKQEEQGVVLYKEIVGEIQAFAQQNGYQLVLGYGQKFEGDINTIENIARIMQGMDQGSATPMFMGLGVDISQAVVESLNRRYQGSVPAVPTSSKK